MLTSRKVSGSIPDAVGFLNWSNLSSRTMGLGADSAPNRIGTKNLPGGKGRSARKADLTSICEPIV
jgi:hypothetical protein